MNFKSGIFHKKHEPVKEDSAPRRENMLLVYEKRLDDLGEFSRHYEVLVDSICDAAQGGPDPELEETYLREKRWMESHYFLVRSQAIQYVEDAEPEMDDFQQLFEPTNLPTLLAADGGNMIPRIVRTREALEAYAEHLRLLIAREKSCS
jgi:hypothetical protein